MAEAERSSPACADVQLPQERFVQGLTLVLGQIVAGWKD
jgi:hypothetical protein